MVQDIAPTSSSDHERATLVLDGMVACQAVPGARAIRLIMGVEWNSQFVVDACVRRS